MHQVKHLGHVDYFFFQARCSLFINYNISNEIDIFFSMFCECIGDREPISSNTWSTDRITPEGAV